MGVAARMRLLVGFALAGLLALCLTALFTLKSGMLDDRKEKTRHVVEVGMGILDHYQKLAAAGKLSDAEARTAAKEALRGLRYGHDDYYFVFTTDHVYVLYPTKPEFEGQNKADMQDSHGKYLVRELVAAAQRGGDFVEYAFPRAGQTTPEAKLSYAAPFRPWGWVLGTGIYIDDIDTAFRHTATVLGAISLLLLAGIGYLGWRTAHCILRQLGGEPAAASAAMKEIAHGKLTVSLGQPHPESLLGSLQAMATSLRELVREIEIQAESLVASSSEITQASNGVSRAAEEEAESTSAIAAAIEELTVSSNQILDIAKETELNSQDAMSLSVQGRERAERASQAIQAIARTVTDASERIRALESRATGISSIVAVIKEIAAQTNLLALNAAIEAARAGEQGRGFAVVADEVRKLAERTTTATVEIEKMIAAIQVETGGAVAAMNEALPEVRQGVALADSASESLRAIEDGARSALDRVHDVANATREQSAASTSIAQQVEQIAQMVDETSVTIRANAATAESLEEVARKLKAQISKFEI